MLAILFALREELKPFLREFKVESRLATKPAIILKGHWKNFPLVLVQTGIGMDKGRIATQKLLAQLQPHHVLSVGYAGGLQPELRVGDVINVREVRDESNQSRTLDPQGTGRLLTVQKPLTSVAEKQAAGRQSFTAVDMETYAEATLFQEKKIPFTALRVIFDPLEEPLTLHYPKLFLKLPQLYWTHRLCQKKLHQALAELIPRLADESDSKDD